MSLLIYCLKKRLKGIDSQIKLNAQSRKALNVFVRVVITVFEMYRNVQQYKKTSFMLLSKF